MSITSSPQAASLEPLRPRAAPMRAARVYPMQARAALRMQRVRIAVARAAVRTAAGALPAIHRRAMLAALPRTQARVPVAHRRAPAARRAEAPTLALRASPGARARRAVHPNSRAAI